MSVTTVKQSAPFTDEERSLIEKQITSFADYYSQRQTNDLSDEQREEYDLMLAMTGALAVIDALRARLAEATKAEDYWKARATLGKGDAE